MNIKGIGTGPVTDLKSQSSPARTEKSPAASGAPQAAVVQGATVELSSKALGLKDIERSLAGSPAVDEQRVRELKQRVDAGTYQVNNQSVAGKLLGLEEIL